MSSRHETMIDPPVEELLNRAESKFRLVTLGSKRARQINAYFGAGQIQFLANVGRQV